MIDLTLVEANIKKLFQALKKPGLAVRPHLKTGKCKEIAQMLLEAGAQGICVAKVSEAEVFTEAGIHDILITTEIAGRPKLDRLLQLLKRNPAVKIVVDNAMVATEINGLAEEYSLNEPVSVLIDVNVGQNRTGVSSASEALELAKLISKLDHFRFSGLQGYEGHLQHLPAAEREEQCRNAMDRLNQVVQVLQASGFDCQVVTTGGTGTAEICADCQNITEVQPGSFVFMDVAYKNAVDGKYANALTVLATVISKPASERAIVDAGLKSLSIDMGMAEPKGMPQLTYRPLGDEHGVIESKSGDVPLTVGQKIELVPSHLDTTIALFDQYLVTRDGKLDAIWNITARGKVQ